MKFICIIIVLALVFSSQLNKVFHRDAWFTHWQAWLSKLPLPPKAVLLLAIAVPVIAVLLLHLKLAGQYYGLAELALMLLVLLYCTGRAEYSDAYARYRRALRCGDIQGAYRAIDLVEQDGASNFAEMHRSAEQRMLHERFDFSFAPVFWFFVAGPAGALLYRLTWLARDTCLAAGANAVVGESGEESGGENSDDAGALTPVMREEARALATPDTLAFGSRWLGWLEWLPARLLAFAFALVGDFNNTIGSITDNFIGTDPTRVNLRRWALAALGTGATDSREEDSSTVGDPDAALRDKSLQCMMDLSRLMRRSLIVWVVAFALGQIII